MSENRQKNSARKVPESEPEPTSARLVAVPMAEAASRPKPKPERIGDILRAARLERNDDLYQIAEYLCIKPAFLVALENSRYDEFPADAYVIGFLRTYAAFLGIDGKEAVDRYRYEMAGRRKKPVLAMPVPMSEGRAPSALIMAGAMVAALLIYALWYGISSANRTDVNAPPPLPVSQQSSPVESAAAGLTAPLAAAVPAPAPAPAAEIQPAAAPVPAEAIPPAAPGIVLSGSVPPASLTQTREEKETIAKAERDEHAAAKAAKSAKEKAADKAAPVPPAAAKAGPAADAAQNTAREGQVYGDPGAASRVIIRATQSSWVMVNDASGKTIFDHVMKAGDTYKVPNRPGLKLTTGNGSGIVLSLDGNDLPRIAAGAPHVVRDIPLDADKLGPPQNSN